MYPKFYLPLALVGAVFFTSCTGTRLMNSNNVAASDFAMNTGAAKYELPENRKAVFVGPPEYIPETPAAKPAITNNVIAKAAVTKPAVPKIIEKGGKYVYIPQSYMRVKEEAGTDKYSAEALNKRIKTLRKFAKENNYDTTLAFFVDMEVKSGKKRFMVVNLKNNEVIKEGLVAHGKGNERFTFDRQFSNDGGSNCTSLGIYRIGKSYNGAFGLSFKLYGLEKTNYNALRRYVVLHSMGSIPEDESKWPITQSEGCPAVAPAFLEELAPMLEKREKNVLMYIYFGNK
ncbi:hypothetical protein OSTOST_00219 [Ostertagia ostertagi]